MEGEGRQEGGREGGSGKSSAASKLKERWLLTRKTWRYMSDAGKKLFPEGVNPQRSEDLPRVEDHFQQINNRSQEFILWPQPQESPRTARRRRQRQARAASDTSDDYVDVDTDHEAHDLAGSRPRQVPQGAMGLPLAPTLPVAMAGAGAGVWSGGGGSPGTSPGLNYGAGWGGRERVVSVGEGSADLYLQQLLRHFGSCNLHHVASRLLEDQLTEEDEDDEDDDYLPGTRSVGAQTDTHLDMCVQTDDDATAEDMVKVGAECRSITEATAAAAQAQARAQAPPTPATPEVSSTSMLKKLWQRRESTASAGMREEAAKDKKGSEGQAKGVVAAKLAWAEKAAAAGGGVPLAPGAQKAKDKGGEKSKLKNVFKLGLKCDVEQGGSVKKTVEKTKVDKFKTVNYDKTLRNIKSKWVANPEDEELLRQYKLQQQQALQARARDQSKVKKKAKAVQVGEPLPQFILTGFRINTPVEIIYQRRRSRRRLSKADSTDMSSSECASIPPSLPTSPRYSITVTDELGTRDLLVSEADMIRLSQIAAHVALKRSSIDASVDTSEFEAEGGVGGVGAGPGVGAAAGHHYQRSISALQASGHLAQLMYNLRGRGSHPQVSTGAGSGSGVPRSNQSLLQSLLPAAMQRSRAGGGGGGGHASKLVAKRIWRARSKSQSRASPATTSIWTPMGGNTWSSVTGRVVSLESTTLLHLTELERVTLQHLALAKLQALNLGCTIRIPAAEGETGARRSDGSSGKQEQASGGCQKKRRPYLLKRKALTTGFFDSKKDEGKDGAEGGLVFGLTLTKCLENERSRSREAAEKAAAAATTAALGGGGSGGSGGEESGEPASRKSSQAGSHASFSSLLEGTKQSSTGSLESLNLERKRPSLVVGTELLPMPPCPTSPDLLMVEPGPQIPGLVNVCLRHLEGTGMRTLGIFRVSSSKKRVRQLREEFDSGREVWLTEDNCPHDVATLLKEFFRDLPEPLLTRDLYHPLIKTQKIRNRKLQFEALQHLVQLMPAANRDTLYSLLTFLAAVAENSEDLITPSGETLQGNRMDSSNLATLFAPNILHTVRPGGEPPSAATLATGAEERIEVINVVRTMIDHNKELFEVPVELLDETYQHLMDTHPEALEVLLRRRCPAPDQRGQHLQDLLATLLAPHRCPSTQLELEVDTGSSVFEGSECSSSLPRSPTDATHHHDFDRARVEEVLSEGGRVRREEVVHEGAAVVISQKSGCRRRGEDEDDGRGRRGEKGSEGGGGGNEERGWWRRREKSLSRELEERPVEKTRWFRKRDKSGARGSRGSRGEEGSGRVCLSTEKGDGAGEVEDGWGEAGVGRLRVPEPTVRRLSSPEIDSSGVITASLRIPVPIGQTAPLSLAHSASHDPSIPYIEDGAEEKKPRQRTTSQQMGRGKTGRGEKGRGETGRQRSGSSDSYLGQPITGTMSFQPLSKKGGDKRSHDSVLSSSSADVFTLSPSPRNTPLSDQYPSGTSSPLSRPSSPPNWLSPDSGTPGLSPPNSPPLQPRRRGGEVRPSPITHSITHTFGSPRPVPVSSKSRTSATGSGVTQGIFPIGRSRTVDSFRVEVGQGEAWASSPGSGDRATGTSRRSSRGDDGGGKGEGGSSGARRYTRRRYTGERHPTGHLPDINAPHLPDSHVPTEGQTQLWKRWEIIASDPTEPETFV